VGNCWEGSGEHGMGGDVGEEDESYKHTEGGEEGRVEHLRKCFQ